MRERYEQIIRSHGVHPSLACELAANLCAHDYDAVGRLLDANRPAGMLVDEVKNAFDNGGPRQSSYLRMCAALGEAYRGQGSMPPLRDGYVVTTADGKVAHRMYGNYHSPGPVYATYMQTLVNVNDIVEVRYEGEVIWRKPRNTIPASTAWDMVTERGYTVEQVKQKFEVKL